MDGLIDNLLIYLTGFMGGGKTQVGTRLAKSLQLPFIDTDQQIECQENMTIPHIFETKGESSFRQMEKALLGNLPLIPAIVSTGGGMVIDSENRNYMNCHGLVIYLYCTPQQTLKRLKDNVSRPLLTSKSLADVEAMMDQRLPYYLENHVTVDTTGKTPECVVWEIIARLNRG